MNTCNFKLTAVLGVMLLSCAGCSIALSNTKGSAPPVSVVHQQYSRDSVLTQKVKAALLDDSMVTGPEIQVQAIDGVVELSGYVHSQTEIDEAIRVTRDVVGTTMVVNKMLVSSMAG